MATRLGAVSPTRAHSHWQCQFPDERVRALKTPAGEFYGEADDLVLLRVAGLVVSDLSARRIEHINLSILCPTGPGTFLRLLGALELQLGQRRN
mmetsp:Transcript_19646/g.78200  ORF Transcript_19646/g.78200 Transcript_19646/m.78200 type:complete len:94 (+) Transcript_19646:470-751(+)|eukprot:CAMPEP_0113972430 /NCGR_PEP_ID=MMETSP0011_2-20120614/13475_1 /TAXON_ID=101924 /ORGANISM="Rhodosorus marinus" /LENGTH=93 /DNA_ID=CAMNT_0000989411 /DNA_START=307 /DNA_END=588 /DNA_ORIENTATION=- /assembly_acc=CAM_ASM_000156